MNPESLPEVIRETATATALGVTHDRLRALMVNSRLPPPVGWLRGEALFDARHVREYQQRAPRN